MNLKNDLNFLDRFALSVFPEWGRRRVEARIQHEAQCQMYATAIGSGGFNALKNDSGLTPITGVEPSEDFSMQHYDRLKAVNTSFVLFHDNPIFAATQNRIVNNLLGDTGLMPIPATGNDDFDEEANKHFIEWALNCDKTGRYDFVDIQNIKARQLMTDGDILSSFYYKNGDNYHPYIQLTDSARIATPPKYQSYEGKKIFNGVELDRHGAPVRYHIGQRDSMWNMSDKSFTSVRARNSHLTMMAKYNSSYRGVTPYLSVFKYLRYIDDIMKYALVQQKTAATFGLIYKMADGKKNALGIALNGNAKDTPQCLKDRSPLSYGKMTPNMMFAISKDEAIESFEAKNPGDNFSSFIDSGNMFIGAAMNIPMAFVLLDFSKANYYGHRMGANQLTKGLCDLFKALMNDSRFCYNRLISDRIAAGRLKLPSDGSLDKTFTEAVFPSPEYIAVDPESETDTEIKRIDNHLKTRTQYFIERRQRFKQVIATSGKEIKYMNRQGVPISTGQPGTQTLEETNARIAKDKKDAKKGKKDEK